VILSRTAVPCLGLVHFLNGSRATTDARGRQGVWSGYPTWSGESEDVMHKGARRRPLRLVTLGALGAVGAALVYFVDPEYGPVRRRAARAWVTATARRALEPLSGVLGASVSPEGPASAPPPRWQPDRAPAYATEEYRFPDNDVPAAAAATWRPAQSAGPLLGADLDLGPEPEIEWHPSALDLPETGAWAPESMESAGAAGRDRERDELEPAGLDERPAGFDLPLEWRPEDVELPPTPTLAASLPAYGHLREQESVSFTRGAGTTGQPQIVAYDAEPVFEPEPERAAVEAPSGRGPAGAPAHGLGLPLRALAALVGVAACAAVGLGVWAVMRADAVENDREANVAQAQAQVNEQARAIALLSQPDAQRLPVKGSNGSMVLVVGPKGDGLLIITSLRRAPVGKIYQSWVIEGKTLTSSGLFAGGAEHLVVPLAMKVPKGATVAVTLEPAGGSKGPTEAPIYFAKRT